MSHGTHEYVMSGWGWNGNSGLYFGGTYEGADHLLQISQQGNYVKLANSAYLGRQLDGSISLTLYETAIVTYHDDGTYTLNHGGWKTNATQGYINGNTPFRIGSSYNRKYKGWSLGPSGEKTPARVQECRTCHGEGGWVKRPHCDGAPRWDYSGSRKLVCDGANTEFALKWVTDRNEGPLLEGQTRAWDEYRASAYLVPCEHGPVFEKSHRLTLCKHGSRFAHDYGEIYATECHRCKGEGRVDYGSQDIPIIWHSSPVRLSADGKVLDMDADRYYPTGKPYTPKGIVADPSPALAPQPTPSYSEKNQLGAETNTVLEALLPAMATVARCPACTYDHYEEEGSEHHDTITNLVMHLNDKVHWTREAIADWLDTLDADLRFPTPIGA